MKLPIYQVDAFTGEVFSGNPAAVCPLGQWLAADRLQAIAAENNLSETAFFVEREDAYELRWFTPTTEVDLCGHATLASAFVIWNRLGVNLEVLKFETRSGPLSVYRKGDLLVLDLPRIAPVRGDIPADLPQHLGKPPAELWTTPPSENGGNYLAVYGTEEEVRSLQPDLAALGRLAGMGVIVTAPAEKVDFVSRYFGPAFGIPEDPVTGSAHCTLVPYWADQIGRTSLRALQVSRRGGELCCELKGDRVQVGGRAVCYLEGTITL